MIFGTRQDQRFNFNLGGHKINICTDFKLIGVVFSRNRHFQQTSNHNVEQAKKAMHVHFKQIRNLNIHPMKQRSLNLKKNCNYYGHFSV